MRRVTLLSLVLSLFAVMTAAHALAASPRLSVDGGGSDAEDDQADMPTEISSAF